MIEREPEVVKKTDNITVSDLLNSGYRYGLSLTSSRQDAEDLVHDAWIRLLNRYEKPPELPLLFKTMRNMYIDQLRKDKLVALHRDSEYVEFSSASTSIEREYVSAEEMQICLSKLKDSENEVVYLSVIEGYTAREIAAFTGSSRGSVLSLLYRSKRKLKEWLSEDGHSASNVVQLVPKNKAVRK